VVALVASGATDAFRSSTGQFNVAGQVVFYICISVVLVISIIMTCFLNVARKYPLNYVLLAIFTIAEGLILSVVAANVYAGTVITVGIVTLTMTGFLTMYAILSKREITMAGTAGVLFFWLVLLVITMSFLYIWAWNYSAVFTYVLIGMVFLYGFFIVWDTKLIVGQNRSGIQLNLDDYILGALLLYTDIIGLFLNLLSLLTRIHH
jgi:FtsH-binding integral membrane protein